MPKKSARRSLGASLPARAAVAALLIGAGCLASYLGTMANREAIRRLEAETTRSQEILAKLTEDLAALRTTMAAARDVEQTSSTATASDRARLAETLDRLAIAVQDPGRKLSALDERIDRMQSEIMAGLNGLATAKPAVAAAAPAGEAGADNPPSVKPVRSEPVEGWVLREVSNGSALVESRSRGLYEVIPGNVIPGVGRVEAIERRGTRWVVVTDRGLIGTYR